MFKHFMALVFQQSLDNASMLMLNMEILLKKTISDMSSGEGKSRTFSPHSDNGISDSCLRIGEMDGK